VSKTDDLGKTAAVKTAADIGLTTDEHAYLRIGSTHPWRLIGEIHSILNNPDIMGAEHTIGQNKAVNIRKKLIKMGYLETFDVLGTGKSGKAMCDLPTEKAQLGKVYKPRGDLLHSFWCHRVSFLFQEKGAKTKIGDTDSGNEVDIDVTIDSKRIGVEIVVSGLVVENITKFILMGYFDEMLILCIDDKKREAMEKSIKGLSDDIRKKVSIGLLKDHFVVL
jgi:hypothetical protein